MDFTEKQIASEEIFRGRIVHLVRDTVVLPDGKEATREIVHHPGAVAVVAVTSDRRVLLVTHGFFARFILATHAGTGFRSITPMDNAEVRCITLP